MKDFITKTPILKGPICNNLFPMQILTHLKNHLVFAARQVSSYLWHQHVCHPCAQTMSRIFGSIKANNCHSCLLRKSYRLHFSSLLHESLSSFEIIHCDIWGPSPTFSFNGFSYFIIFVDDFNLYTRIFPLSHKAQALDKLENFKVVVENLFSTTIKSFQCDGASKLTKVPFALFLQTHGISYRILCPYTLEHNGLSERKIRIITEIGLTRLIHAHLPKNFCFDSFHTAAYLINVLPTSTCNNNSPHEKLFSKPLSLNYLRIFGCQCFPYLCGIRHDKLTPKS